MAENSIAEIAAGVLRRDLRSLARAATLIERGGPAEKQLISDLFSSSGKANMIGFTGPGGVGKSTLISSYIRHLRGRGHTVGVIAIDPSSAISNGALLGDRVRMLEHAGDSGVFIRSCATRGMTGGLSAGTMSLAVVLDAAGFDFVIVETVGAGQDEIDIVCLADVTVVVLAPGFGDGVQAIKAGMMEIASVFVINKADQHGASNLHDEIKLAQSLSDSDPRVPVCKVTAIDDTGIGELTEIIDSIAHRLRVPGKLEERWKQMLILMMKEQIVHAIDASVLSHHAKLVSQRLESPYAAAQALVSSLQATKGRS